MTPAEHVACSEQETSFNETPGTSSDEHAAVPTENSIVDEPELLQNQVAVSPSNIIVRQLSESFDDWSTSSESDGTQNQLQKREPNGITRPLDLFGNETKFVSTFTGNTNLHPTFTDTRIFKGPVTFHQNKNVYCCPPTFFDALKSCSNKRCIATFVATLTAILIFVFLCIWFLTSNVTKQINIPDTPITNKTIDAGHWLSTADSAPTVSSEQVVHVSTEALPNDFRPVPRVDYLGDTKAAATGKLLNSTELIPIVSSNKVVHIFTEAFSDESTVTLIADHSHNTNGQKKEKTESIDANNPLKIITRSEWDAARPLKPLIKLTVLPAVRVIISETLTESCDETEKCMQILRSLQRLQSNPVSCPDIAYNFLVGADGLIYEGRGWDMKGNVASYFDHESINIAFIGNFSLIEPPEKQVQAALKLIRVGVENGNINMFFKLNGKRQLVYISENPGDKLYNIITKWQQWEPGTIGIDFHNKVFDEEYNQTMSYLNIFSGTKLKYIPKRGRN